MGVDERRDLERLNALAFRRGEKTGDLVRLFYQLSKAAKQHPDFKLLEVAYGWLFVPFSLWPIDVAGLVRFVIATVSNNRRVDPQLRFLIQMLPELPDKKAADAVTAHEHDVQKGVYDSFIEALHKYNEIADALAENPVLQGEWVAIKKTYDVTKYANRGGVITRRMVQERNFRPDWEFRWNKKDDQFKLVFDAFCCRWDLYGMEKDKPLLLKLSVNLTAFGTMVMVPRYWSLDGHRDIRWKVAGRLHRARGVFRQGPKMSRNRTAMRDETLRAAEFWQQATKLNMKGSKRVQWVMNRLGWLPHTDPERLRTALKRQKLKWYAKSIRANGR